MPKGFHNRWEPGHEQMFFLGCSHSRFCLRNWGFPTGFIWSPPSLSEKPRYMIRWCSIKTAGCISSRATSAAQLVSIFVYSMDEASAETLLGFCRIRYLSSLWVSAALSPKATSALAQPPYLPSLPHHHQRRG